MTVTTATKSFYSQYKEGTYSPEGFTRDLIQLYEKAHHHDQKRLRMAYPTIFGLDEYEAIATIYCAGDKSVGIFDFSYTMTLHRDMLSSPEEREQWRKHIAAMYIDILDGFRPVVSFDDEHEDHDEE